MNGSAPLAVGAHLVPVTISPVVAGILQTTRDDGVQRLWQLGDDRLIAVLGCGVIARTHVGGGRLREVGLLDESGGVLVLPARRPHDEGGVEAVDVVHVHPVSGMAIASEEQVGRYLNDSLARVLGRLAPEGGDITLEVTLPEAGSGRYIRFRAVDGGVEVLTRPARWSDWGPYSEVDGEGRLRVSGEATSGPMLAALAVYAFAEWECSPWDVSLTFTPVPSNSSEETPEAVESPETNSDDVARSQVRAAIGAVQGLVRVDPLGGAHWTEGRLGLGVWPARVVIDSEAGMLLLESQIPGVVETARVEEALEAMAPDAPEASYRLVPGPQTVTLTYRGPLQGVHPWVFVEAARKLAEATSVVAANLWGALSPIEHARLGRFGIHSPEEALGNPSQMVLAAPVPHYEWDERKAPVSEHDPVSPELPDGVVGVIPGPLGPEWDSTIEEVREVLADLASMMIVQVGRHGRDDEVYVQISSDGPDELFAEAVSNTFLEGASRLTDAEMQRLRHLGWSPPTGDDEPNWYRTFDASDAAATAELVLRTLRDAYGADPEADVWLISWSDLEASEGQPPVTVAAAAEVPALAPEDAGSDVVMAFLRRIAATDVTVRGNGTVEFTLGETFGSARPAGRTEVLMRCHVASGDGADKAEAFARRHSSIGLSGRLVVEGDEHFNMWLEDQVSSDGDWSDYGRSVVAMQHAWRQSGNGSSSLRLDLSKGGIAAPPFGAVKDTDIDVFGRWHWGSRYLDARAMYLFDVDAVMRPLVSEGH